MFNRWICAALIAVVSVHAFAAEDAEQAVRDAFKKISPTAVPTSVTPSELPGFYQVLVDASVYFISSDGKYLIRGNVYDIASKQDLGEKQLAALRKSTLDNIPASDELVFAPKDPKYTVTVFTDVDCPYCREFHKQIAEYNKLGIAVRYVFFPLPMHAGADKKAEAVWCSADRNASYTEAMNGKDPGKNTCANPIAETVKLGKSMGVDGTPAVFTPEGDHIGGYVAPDQLVKRLEQLAQRGKEATRK